MRTFQLVDSKVAVVATSTTYVTLTPPSFAQRATLYFTSLMTGTGTATLDFALQENIPAVSAAPVVATTVTGTTGTFAVQTITMTGEPTDGSLKFGVTGKGTNTVFTTAYMPIRDIKNRPSKIGDFLAQAGINLPEDLKFSAVLGTGASTPTVFTLTYSGGYTLAQTAVAVTGDRLYNWTRSAINFADWDGVTQRTSAASTATNYDVVRIGPGESGIADDDTAATYKINATLPPQLVTKVTVLATATGLASYSVFVAWSS